MENQTNLSEKSKIIYIFDPMCGWCFAFSNVMFAITEQYAGSFDFKVLSGGMMIGDGAVPAYQMADFILKAYKRVEQTAGVTFGEKYLDIFREGSYILNSELACKVVTAVKEVAPEHTYSIVKDIQNAHFVEGRTLNSMATFEYILNKYDFDLNKFNIMITSEDIAQKTYAEFEFVKKLGVRGFPAVLLNHKDKFYSVTSGYTSLESMQEVLDNIIDNIGNIN